MHVVTETVEYLHGDTCLKGFIAYPKDANHLSGVLIAPDWSGCNDFAKEKAIELAKKGFVGFAVDMYGNGAIGETKEEKQALMMPVVSNRPLLRERINIAFQYLSHHTKVNKDKCFAIGFCFGGLCVLDLARMGAEVKGVVSFHGLLGDSLDLPRHAIKSEILALHGYDDPMVTPQDLVAFAEEMTSKKANWEVNIYGKTMHAFTNPLAQDPGFGTVFQPDSAQKAFASMYAFFDRLL